VRTFRGRDRELFRRIGHRRVDRALEIAPLLRKWWARVVRGVRDAKGLGDVRLE
jgi:hypothetical protein